MKKFTERKYRFTYGYADPEAHPECPDFEGVCYVQLSDTDVIEEGKTPTEAGFLAVAADYFDEVCRSMEVYTLKNYELRSISVVPVTGTVKNPSDTVKKLMDDYTNEADSMTDLILCWLAEDDSHALTDEDIQTLIEFAGDEDYMTVEDIRHMATGDAIYDVEPYKSMRAMLDVVAELDVGTDHFTKRMSDIDRRIEADTANLSDAKTKGETGRYLHRISQLKNYKSILRLIGHINHLESIVGGRIDLDIAEYDGGTPNIILIKAED